MTHDTANNIRKKPSPAPKYQKNVDSHPKPEHGTAKFDGSKSRGNNASHYLDMGFVDRRWSPPSRITLASATVLHVSAWTFFWPKGGWGIAVARA